MLQQENRLKKIRDFNLVIKNGRFVSGVFLSAKIVELNKIKELFPKKEEPDEFQKQLRIAFSIGLKISKSAVKRNAVKRKLREVVRLLLKDNKIRVGYFILITTKKEILEKNYSEIEKEINDIFKKAKILC